MPFHTLPEDVLACVVKLVRSLRWLHASGRDGRAVALRYLTHLNLTRCRSLPSWPVHTPRLLTVVWRVGSPAVLLRLAVPGTTLVVVGPALDTETARALAGATTRLCVLTGTFDVPPLTCLNLVKDLHHLHVRSRVRRWSSLWAAVCAAPALRSLDLQPLQQRAPRAWKGLLAHKPLLRSVSIDFSPHCGHTPVRQCLGGVAALSELCLTSVSILTAADCVALSNVARGVNHLHINGGTRGQLRVGTPFAVLGAGLSWLAGAVRLCALSLQNVLLSDHDLVVLASAVPTMSHLALLSLRRTQGWAGEGGWRNWGAVGALVAALDARPPIRKRPRGGERPVGGGAAGEAAFVLDVTNNPAISGEQLGELLERVMRQQATKRPLELNMWCERTRLRRHDVVGAVVQCAYAPGAAGGRRLSVLLNVEGGAADQTRRLVSGLLASNPHLSGLRVVVS